MKYIDFKEKLQKLRIFSLQDIRLIDENFRLPTLYGWEDKGLVKKIRNNWYVFGDFDPKDLDFYLIANRIYDPSYVSLHMALNMYGVIPEVVQQITSVSTLKTQEFDTSIGLFSYKSVKESLFFGYKIVDHEGVGVKLASLEKALLDILYLYPEISSVEDIEGMRYNRDQIKDKLDVDLFNKYLKIFDSKSLDGRAQILLNYLYS